MKAHDEPDDTSAVAVIGMAARFPGAGDVRELWENACRRARPSYGAIEDADTFDNEFFGLSPQEAMITDPQHRVLLECTHHALEDAGCDPHQSGDIIGIYAGGGSTPYASLLRRRLADLPYVDDWQIRIGTANDFLATRAAYKLKLSGPAVTVQASGATWLVAIHNAAQALLAGECDMALAGGASVLLPAPHPETEQGDAPSAGAGSGVGMVVLKLLRKALDAGDHIHAVLRGSGVNHNGGGPSFTATGAEGRARLIRDVHTAAGVAAETTTAVEAAGSGGRTDAAAGIADFLEAVLSVEHGVISETLARAGAGPRPAPEATPADRSTAPAAWPATEHPRRAGISASGAGGTNAYVIIEQPPRQTRPPAQEGWHLLPLSAKNEAALTEMTARLGEHLAGGRTIEPADVAFTLQTGRTAHPHRRFLVTDSTADAAAVLKAGRRRRLPTGKAPRKPADVVFTFSGQGGQHVGMTRDLYRHDHGFRADIDRCARLALPALGLDLRSVLYPEGPDAEAAAGRALAGIGVGQPAVFIVEYALSRLLMRWGVRPTAVTGHSLGAYAAACTAGVFSVEDALAIVVKRGQLLQSLPSGSMAAVTLPESELSDILPEGLSIGAINGPDQTAVSGPTALVEQFVRDFPRPDVEVKLLKIATAGHSTLVEPVLDEFEQFVAQAELRAPTIPFISDTTGQWTGAPEVTTSAYWRTHMRRPVRFHDVLGTLAERPHSILLEAGPGLTLTSLARRHPALGEDFEMVQTLPHPTDPTPELSVLLTALGRLWLAGTDVDFEALHRGRSPRRAKLPGYPFQRRSFLPAGTQAPADHGGVPASAPSGPVTVAAP
nr:type I polyketide synthase 10 [Streptomyces sp.]